MDDNRLSTAYFLPQRELSDFRNNNQNEASIFSPLLNNFLNRMIPGQNL